MGEDTNFEQSSFRMADVKYLKIKEHSKCRKANITKVTKIENEKLRR